MKCNLSKGDFEFLLNTFKNKNLLLFGDFSLDIGMHGIIFDEEEIINFILESRNRYSKYLVYLKPEQ
ncbi:hypothetical protein HZB88_03425 [archaeon]|nr:hypothetical protein [archaeon]